LINIGGIIADIWDPVGAGHALGVFTASVFIGPVLGPIIGG
jgi:MFS family permease